MANTHHTGIPKLQWSFAYPPCSPSVSIVADKNPFCSGDSVTFTPTFNCVDDVTITAYAWLLDGAIVSTSAEPYVSNTLYNNARIGLLFITSTGQNYFSNLIVMQEQTIDCPEIINYGLLFNSYAINDPRKITSSDTWEIAKTVGVGNDWYILVNYLGTDLNVGGFLKETGTLHWNLPNTGASNSVGFNLRGAGYREGTNGLFTGLNEYTTIGTSDINAFSGQYIVASYTDTKTTYAQQPKRGVSVRPFRDATLDEQLLDDGSPCENYIGNDGKIYRTVKINTQVWLSQNLAETQFRNGDYIHGYEGGSYQAISNAAWVALTTDGVCCYNDDINLI